MAQSPINDNIDLRANKRLDSREGPYANTAAAIAAIPEIFRVKSLTVYIENGSDIDEYWWESGTADVDLVAKTSGAGISTDSEQILETGSDDGIYLQGVPYTVATYPQVAGTLPSYTAAEIDAIRIAEGFENGPDLVPDPVNDAYIAAGSPSGTSWWIYLGATSVWFGNGSGWSPNPFPGGGWPFPVDVFIGCVDLAGVVGGRGLVDLNLGPTFVLESDGTYTAVPDVFTLQQVLDSDAAGGLPGSSATTSTRAETMELGNTRGGSSTTLVIKNQSSGNSLGLEIDVVGTVANNVGMTVRTGNEGLVNRGIVISNDETLAEDLDYISVDMGDFNNALVNSTVRGFSVRTNSGFSADTNSSLTGIFMDLRAGTGTGSRSFMQLIDDTEGLGKVLTSDADGNATWQDLPGGITETLTFGGGSSGDVASLEITNGIITSRTLVP